VRVPSDPIRSLPNTCSPRRPPAARRSARSASWCARLFRRPRSSRRWVRHRRLSGIPAGLPPPPPRAYTRTAGHSVVTPAGAGRDRPRHGRRSASRRYPIARRGGPDNRPPAPGLGGRARRPGRRHGAGSSTHSGRPRAARAPWARQSDRLGPAQPGRLGPAQPGRPRAPATRPPRAKRSFAALRHRLAPFARIPSKKRHEAPARVAPSPPYPAAVRPTGRGGVVKAGRRARQSRPAGVVNAGRPGARAGRACRRTRSSRGRRGARPM
jgi:hypothetical protein